METSGPMSRDVQHREGLHQRCSSVWRPVESLRGGVVAREVCRALRRPSRNSDRNQTASRRYTSTTAIFPNCEDAWGPEVEGDQRKGGICMLCRGVSTMCSAGGG